MCFMSCDGIPIVNSTDDQIRLELTATNPTKVIQGVQAWETGKSSFGGLCAQVNDITHISKKNVPCGFFFVSCGIMVVCILVQAKTRRHTKAWMPIRMLESGESLACRKTLSQLHRKLGNAQPQPLLAQCSCRKYPTTKAKMQKTCCRCRSHISQQ